MSRGTHMSRDWSVIGHVTTDWQTGDYGKCCKQAGCGSEPGGDNHIIT